MTDTPKNDNNFADQKSLTALKLHGEKIIYAVLLVLAVFFGWQYYQKNYAKIDTVAADAYTSISARDEQLVQAYLNPELDAAGKQALAEEEKQLLGDIDALVEAHGDTAYAWQALMIKARHQTNNNDLEGAVATLSQAASIDLDDDGLTAIAKIRHARAMLANGDAEGALSIANETMPTAFEASRQELLGDIYHARNEIDNAKAAYTKAWEALRERQENRAVLALKLQSLGVSVEPIEPAQSVVSIPNTQPAVEGGDTSQIVEHDSAVADTQNPQNGN
ncbi:tetratricopeptide repeat protein [Moraxella canis]|uniref:Ancillary SecYEG translocon subunit n=1 Tax=Moraxella canis TaxID=90239 RepID=A0ABZ0WZ00_9GAMM|nr:tetratricopeptide repeat protein [Moraxella canis]WQE04267.1 tetratricopeptide repeat protein [Moraxella canis]